MLNDCACFPISVYPDSSHIKTTVTRRGPINSVVSAVLRTLETLSPASRSDSLMCWYNSNLAPRLADGLSVNQRIIPPLMVSCRSSGRSAYSTPFPCGDCVWSAIFPVIDLLARYNILRLEVLMMVRIQILSSKPRRSEFMLNKSCACAGSMRSYLCSQKWNKK